MRNLVSHGQPVLQCNLIPSPLHCFLFCGMETGNQTKSLQGCLKLFLVAQLKIAHHVSLVLAGDSRVTVTQGL